MINWKDYHDEISNLMNKNLSSSSIATVLAKIHQNPDLDKPRQVRRQMALLRGEIESVVKPIPKHKAKILIFDIETAPFRTYVWSFWKQNVGQNQVISDWFCLTWAAKWLFEDNVMSARLTEEEVLNEDDERIVKEFWKLLDEADIVIAHNANGFDIPKLNTKFLQYGLHPPSPYEVIDTLLHLRKRFKFGSNRLNYVNMVLGLDVKQDTGGFDLWSSCLGGNVDSLKKMESYNIQDVKILEDLYLKMRSWIQPHPNIGLYVDENIKACPSCGHHHLEPCGTYSTYANSYEALRCTSCGSISRERRNNVSKEKKQNLVISTPR